MEPITILIVDDHTVAREGLRAMLETDAEIRVVGEATNGAEAIEQSAALHPDVILLDVRMPGLGGIEVVRQLKDRAIETAVIMITSYDDDALIVDAVRAGADGYLMKDVSRDLLSHTIKAVVSGGVLIKASLLRKVVRQLSENVRESEARSPDGGLSEKLTDRECEILRLVAEGQTNKEIADRLALAEVTIKKHVQSIIAKMRASDRTHAAITGMRLGLIT